MNYPDIGVFDSDGSIDWTDINQGGAGTCYIKAAMAALAEFPEMTRSTFVNEETNDEGIYNVRFFIRGKPWVVTIDDHLLFFASQSSPSLVFSSPSKDGDALWGALLEKAWAKVKGNYVISEGGMTATGIRALTGAPVFDYYTYDFSSSSTAMDDMWDLLVDADAKGYVMGAGTVGSGDAYSNDCGIAMSHAYSIISVFTMTDAEGEEHKALLIRNPWGSNGYSWHWKHNDPKWTDELVA